MKEVEKGVGGSLNIFIHGILQDGGFFEQTAKSLQNQKDSKFIDIGIASFRGEKNDANISDSNCSYMDIMKKLCVEMYRHYSNNEYERVKELQFIPSQQFNELTEKYGDIPIKSKINRLIKEGYNIALRFDTSRIDEFIEETKKDMRKAIKYLCPGDMKFNLIGHSRGGLACVNFALDYPRRVNKVVTIGTPYNESGIARYINLVEKFICKGETKTGKELGGTKITLQEQLEKWNEKGAKKINLTAIGFDTGINGDLIVDTTSQLAGYKQDSKEYKGVNRILVKDNSFSCTHFTECYNMTLIDILSKILTQPEKLNKDLKYNSKYNSKYKGLLDRIADSKATGCIKRDLG